LRGGCLGAAKGVIDPFSQHLRHSAIAVLRELPPVREWDTPIMDLAKGALEVPPPRIPAVGHRS